MKKVALLFAFIAVTIAASAQKTKTAGAILTAFLTSVGAESPQVSASYFAKDGAIELPYVGNLGMPDKIVTQDSIAYLIGNLIKMAPDFRIKNIRIIMENPGMALAEYESEALLANGRKYQQLYMSYAVIKDGKIVKQREVMNSVLFVQAFFPNGMADLPANNK